MIVCICRVVSERTVREAIQRGVESVDEVSAACGAGGGCGACRPAIAELIAESCGEGDPRCADCPRRGAASGSPYLVASQAA